MAGALTVMGTAAAWHNAGTGPLPTIWALGASTVLMIGMSGILRSVLQVIGSFLFAVFVAVMCAQLGAIIDPVGTLGASWMCAVGAVWFAVLGATIMAPQYWNKWVFAAAGTAVHPFFMLAGFYLLADVVGSYTWLVASTLLTVLVLMLVWWTPRLFLRWQPHPVVAWTDQLKADWNALGVTPDGWVPHPTVGQGDVNFPGFPVVTLANNRVITIVPIDTLHGLITFNPSTWFRPNRPSILLYQERNLTRWLQTYYQDWVGKTLGKTTPVLFLPSDLYGSVSVSGIDTPGSQWLTPIGVLPARKAMKQREDGLPLLSELLAEVSSPADVSTMPLLPNPGDDSPVAP